MSKFGAEVGVVAQGTGFDEKEFIAKALRDAQGDVAAAAKALDIPPRLMQMKVREYDLDDLVRR